MKPTRIVTLMILIGVGLALGVLLQIVLVAAGQSILNPPYTFGITLAVLGVALILLALPVRRAITDRTKPVDPFYATRVLVLGKASALVAAVFVGGGIGLLLWLLTRPVIGVGSVPQAIVTLVGALLLLAGGYLTEQLCRIPPPDDAGDDTLAEKG